MNEAIDFGPRLSGEEYDRRVAELYSGQPPMPDEGQDRELRRAELDLQIDHRLGIGFPRARREQLFDVMIGLEKTGPVFALREVFSRFLPSLLVRNARFLADDTVRACAKVLSPAELRQFLDLEEGERVPGMPVDLGNMPK